MIRYIKQFLKKYPHTYTLLIFVALFIWFELLEYHITEPKYIMHIALDDYIPFAKIFIIPYVLWFAYIAVTMTYFLFRSKASFLRLSTFIYIGMAFSLICYMIFPNGQDMRPEQLGTSFLDMMINWIYQHDTALNCFPSIHVINTIATNTAICDYGGFRHPKWVKTGSIILSVLICISTMTVKQHSIVDVLGGLGVSIILYVCIYKFDWSLASEKRGVETNG